MLFSFGILGHLFIEMRGMKANLDTESAYICMESTAPGQHFLLHKHILKAL